MFGRTKATDGHFLESEFRTALSSVAASCEQEYPDVSKWDVQIIAVWLAASLLHCVCVWGRINEQEIGEFFVRVGAMWRGMSDEEAWNLETLQAEIEQCQSILREHVSALNYNGIRAAVTAFFSIHQQTASLPMTAFEKIGVTTLLGTVARLRNSRHIKT